MDGVVGSLGRLCSPRQPKVILITNSLLITLDPFLPPCVVGKYVLSVIPRPQRYVHQGIAVD